MIVQSSCIGFKSRETQGHFKDRHSSNINNVFCGFMINTKNVALHEYYFFRILYWFVNFHYLNTVPEGSFVCTRGPEKIFP